MSALTVKSMMGGSVQKVAGVNKLHSKCNGQKQSSRSFSRRDKVKINFKKYARCNYSDFADELFSLPTAHLVKEAAPVSVERICKCQILFKSQQLIEMPSKGVTLFAPCIATFAARCPSLSQSCCESSLSDQHNGTALICLYKADSRNQIQNMFLLV